MTNRRVGLGRGLDALIPVVQPNVEQVDIDLIAPNPYQPRTHFDPEALALQQHQKPKRARWRVRRCRHQDVEPALQKRVELS